MHKLFLCWLFFLSLRGYSQNPVHDSIYNAFHGKVWLAGGLDSRNSFINNRKAAIWGIKGAVEFGELIQLGIGYNRLDDDLRRTVYFPIENGGSDSAEGQLKMDYVSWYARYVFFRKGKWKFSVVPFQLGIGRSRYRYDWEGQKKYIYKSPVIIYETGFSVSYKVIRWLGVGADVGVRYMVKDNPEIPEKFNSPQYAFYAIIYWSEIGKSLFPNSRFFQSL